MFYLLYLHSILYSLQQKAWEGPSHLAFLFPSNVWISPAKNQKNLQRKVQKLSSFFATFEELSLDMDDLSLDLLSRLGFRSSDAISRLELLLESDFSLLWLREAEL